MFLKYKTFIVFSCKKNNNKYTKNILFFNYKIMYKKVLTSVLIVGVTSIATFASYSAVIDFAKTDLDAANSLAEKKIINDHKENPEKYNLESHVLRQEIAAVAR
ncbi:hypothetical protein HOG21_07075 [bacterium]|jgi:hypothetical protein|nr:hypothetical protein [bacterium]